jgi:putative heme-binding domain-containing protein
MRETEGRATLSAGDHALRLDFVQGEGEAGCILSWATEGTAKEVIPAAALWHQPAAAKPAAQLPAEPGLRGEFFELGGQLETFPDVTASEFDPLLVGIAIGNRLPLEARVQAAAAATARLPRVDSALFDFLLLALDAQNPPLVRMDAADAVAKATLDRDQLKSLARVLARAGVLEVPRLLPAFEQSADAAVGQALLTALAGSPGLKGIAHDTLAALVEGYPEPVRQQAQPVLQWLTIDRAQQTARLAELSGALATGDIQRGRELFFANQKAICATCHAVQGQGGKIGPDLSRIGAIRTARDLLEAVVFPSASFARGYEPVTLVTNDGRVTSGIIARETAESIYVVDNARAEVAIPRGSIETLEQGRVSIMPEGMDTQLSRQDLADLIAFLQSLQ